MPVLECVGVIQILFNYIGTYFKTNYGFGVVFFFQTNKFAELGKLKNVQKVMSRVRVRFRFVSNVVQVRLILCLTAPL